MHAKAMGKATRKQFAAEGNGISLQYIFIDYR
jgi:hypothetical protein